MLCVFADIKYDICFFIYFFLFPIYLFVFVTLVLFLLFLFNHLFLQYVLCVYYHFVAVIVVNLQIYFGLICFKNETNITKEKKAGKVFKIFMCWS